MSVFAHGFSSLLLAFRMSIVNMEQMAAVRAAAASGTKPGEAAAAFLRSPYYRSWSRAQLNNAEYAPMLALLCFALKYKADQRKDALGASEKAACVGSVAFSWVFIYACATQGALKLGKDMRPGQGGMSPLRPIGAMGRYASMAALLLSLARRAVV
jgi:hypothetical protein